MTDYTKRALAWLTKEDQWLGEQHHAEADPVFVEQDRKILASLAAEFAAVAAEARAEGRRQGLEEAANVCGSHYRGYKLAADFITQPGDGPLPEDHKAEAVMAAADAIRALAGGGA